MRSGTSMSCQGRGGYERSGTSMSCRGRGGYVRSSTSMSCRGRVGCVRSATSLSCQGRETAHQKDIKSVAQNYHNNPIEKARCFSIPSG